MKTTLYIASSLDGYIAGPDGDLKWLDAFNSDESDYGFHDFIDSVDTLIMGKHTYKDIVNFGTWPYGDKPSYILSHTTDLEIMKGANATVLEGDVSSIMEQLTEQGAEHVWLVGGATVIQQFMKSDILDEIRLFMMPQTLGDGVKLFLSDEGSRKWNLKQHRGFPNGVI